jgi:putative transposase
VKTVCEVLGVARSNVTVRAKRSVDWADGRKNRRPADDQALVAEIRAEVAELPTYGYRRTCEFVRRRRRAHHRPPVNHKRVYRVMRSYGLLLPRSPRRGTDRRHDGRVAVDLSDTRWCSDALEIRADNGERVRMAFSLDCCDREVLSWVAVANGGIDGNLVRDMMLEAVENRFGMLAARRPSSGSRTMARPTSPGTPAASPGNSAWCRSPPPSRVRSPTGWPRRSSTRSGATTCR